MTEIKVTPLEKLEEFGYGIDQFKNVYQRLVGKVSWECIFNKGDYLKLDKVIHKKCL